MITPIMITVLMMVGIFRNIYTEVSDYRKIKEVKDGKKFIRGCIILNMWFTFFIVTIWWMYFAEIPNDIIIGMILFITSIISLPFMMLSYSEAVSIRSYVFTEETIEDNSYSGGRRLRRYAYFLLIWNTMIIIYFIAIYYFCGWPSRVQSLIDSSTIFS